ncbi:MAG: hypothetical protein H6817_08825 [Phycisphaerales bacterium]|nr:hypothetical protein [Phycisphaerales bacterium]
MSVELFTYSGRSEVVERAALARQLQREGWDVLFVANWPDTELVVQGPCADDLIIGCKPTSDFAPIHNLILKKDSHEIEKLLGDHRYANCAMEIESPYDFSANYDDDDIDDLASDLGSEAVQAMKQAATMYCVRVHGMQNELSSYLQLAVWKSLGALCGGLMENPQTGETYILHADPSLG